MRHWGRRAAVAAVAPVALAFAVAGCGGPAKGERVGILRWTLIAVSDDARTLTIEHEEPHCTTTAGAPVVRERADEIEITVPEVSDGSSGEVACTLEERIGSSTVRLRAPLGDRALRAPTLNGRMRTLKERPILRLRPQECLPLARIPEGAPARAVPWVTNRIASCTAPLPSRLRELPILRRPRTIDDRLPADLVALTRERGPIVRSAASRRIKPGAPVWLVPGPRWTCLARTVTLAGIRGSHPAITDCVSSNTVARRGLLASARCVRSTPTTIALLGVVPGGVERVRLVPSRGIARSIAVREDGTWSATAPYPLEVAWGATRVRTTYDLRSC